MTITLKDIYESATRLLKVFNAHPSAKHSMGKLMEETLELHEAILHVERRSGNFILKQHAAREGADVIVTVVNALYSIGVTEDDLEAAMSYVMVKNQRKDETTHFYDGETIKKIQPVAMIESGE